MRQLLIDNIWPFRTSITILLASIFAFLCSWVIFPTLGGSFAIYWFEIFYPKIRIFFPLVVIPVLMFAIMLWVLVKRRGDRTFPLIVGCLILANLIAFAACLPASRYHQQENVLFADHRYFALLSDGHPGVGMGLRSTIDLYECDTHGLICRFIYSYGGWIQNTADQEPYPWIVRFITTNSLALEINGEIMYTHQP